MLDPLPAWAEQLAVFDTETTGVATKEARIVTASLAVIDGEGNVSQRYDWMLNPEVDIPEGAARIHGISTEMAREQGMDAAAGIKQILEQLQRVFSSGFPLVVYNAPFDLSLLYHEAMRHGVPFIDKLSPVLDPLIIDKQLDRYRRGKRTLVVASEHYGVDLSQAHDAGADAIAAGQVLQEIARKFSAKLPDDIEELHAKQVEWAEAQAQNFEEYMRSKRDPEFTADRRWPLQS